MRPKRVCLIIGRTDFEGIAQTGSAEIREAFAAFWARLSAPLVPRVRNERKKAPCGAGWLGGGKGA